MLTKQICPECNLEFLKYKSSQILCGKKECQYSRNLKMSKRWRDDNEQYRKEYIKGYKESKYITIKDWRQSHQ